MPSPLHIIVVCISIYLASKLWILIIAMLTKILEFLSKGRKG